MQDIDEAELRPLLLRLRSFALGLARDMHVADDLVQSCIEQAIVKWSSRRVDGNLYGWLCAILYRQFLDGRRASARFNRWMDILRGDDVDMAPSAEETWEHRSSIERLDDLSAEQRAVLLLVSVEGMTYQDIAESLGVPIGTVMSRLSRARKAFRQAMDATKKPTKFRIVR
nr:sigma-70 family RNA polymerase sigma factor [Luteibacter jiangsuensis]